MAIGTNLRKIRISRGFTQMEVARQIRVSNQAVYFWESEKRIPGVLHLNALARLFECDISDFLQEKEGNRI